MREDKLLGIVFVYIFLQAGWASCCSTSSVKHWRMRNGLLFAIFGYSDD